MIANYPKVCYPMATVERIIHEHGGQMLQVEYRMAKDGVPTIISIRALGSRFEPEGPNLLPLLLSMVVMLEPTTATPFLCLISESIHESRSVTGKIRNKPPVSK